MPKIWIRDTTWKGLKGLWVRDGGTWKPVKQAWIRDGGAWKECFALPVIVSVVASPYIQACGGAAAYCEGVATLTCPLGTDYELYWWYSTNGGTDWTGWGVDTTGTVQQDLPTNVWQQGTADPNTYPTSTGYLRWRCVVCLAGGGAEQGSRVESNDAGGDGETGSCI